MREAHPRHRVLSRLLHERARKQNKKKGQGLVEFAVTAPFVLLMIFGIIDIARLVQAQVTVNSAARQAIRYAITGHQERDAGNTGWITRTDTISQIAVSGLNGLPLSTSNNPNQFGFNQVEINPPDGAGPNQVVEISVYYNVEMLTPLVNVILPHLMLKGFERGINEGWGAVQTFDHANLPPTPPPLPTWTPIPTSTPTVPARTATVTRTLIPTTTPTPLRTITPTVTQTSTSTVTPTALSTNTPVSTPTLTATTVASSTRTSTTTLTPTVLVTNTPTMTPVNTATLTPTITHTATRTVTPTVTVTMTATPVRRLTITGVSIGKPNGNKPVDVSASVVDQAGAPYTAATVSVDVSGTINGTFTMNHTGGGVYKACSIGTVNNGSLTANVTASAAGYLSGSGSSTTIGSSALCP